MGGVTCPARRIFPFGFDDQLESLPVDGNLDVKLGTGPVAFVQDESLDLADEGAQLPRSKVRKFGFTRPPGFGEIGSQSGGHAPQYSNGGPNLPIRVLKAWG